MNKYKVKGQSDWHKFVRQSKQDLSKAFSQLEKSVRPKAKKKARKKKAARKKARR
jgi:hypothetical protein